MEYKPFDESIIDIISNAAGVEMPLIVELLEKTKISKNHDAILIAWNKRVKALGCTGFPPTCGMLQSLEEQKKGN